MQVFPDTVVLVIGASSGIGHQTALLFLKEGALVMASARREHRLKELEPHGIAIHPADATDPAAMERLAAATLAKYGRIDIMVYATGANTPDRALDRLTPAVWNMIVDVNLNGAYYASRAALPAMRKQQSGLIFYISSQSSLTPDQSGASYQASKRGLAGLAGAIRFEEKQNGIRTCIVCPGLTDTEILEKRPVKPTP
ncbi:MAG: SDR family oxidoreductase, partial [Terriglobia bacterium]